MVHGIVITTENVDRSSELQQTLEVIESEEDSGMLQILLSIASCIEYQDETSQEEVIHRSELKDKCEFNTIKIFEENERLKKFVQDLGNSNKTYF